MNDHMALRPLARFMVEVRLEPVEAQGISTVVDHLLHMEKSQTQSQEEISIK